MRIKLIVLFLLFPLLVNAALVEEGNHGIIVTEMENGQLDSINFIVTGIVQDNGAGYSTILVSFPDSVMQNYGVASGMSGSPAYIDGKLIGALSSTWPFLNKPMANITPIGEMHNLKNKASAIHITGKTTDIYVSYSTPPFLSFADSIMRKRNLDVKSASASDSAYDISPGHAIGISLISGDMTAAVVGTITEIRGNELYAFGHPALGLGNTKLPLASCKTMTTASSEYMSFKIPIVGRIVGEVINDGYSGILASLNKKAPTIKTVFNIDGNLYNYDLASSSYLSPLLFQMAAFHASSKSFLQNDKNSFIVRFNIAGKNVHIKSTLFGKRKFAPFNFIASISSVLNNIYDNSKREMSVNSISINITTVDRDLFRNIKDISIVPKWSRRNGTFEINITTSRFQKGDSSFSIKYSDNRLRPGRYTLTVMGRDTYVGLLEHYKFFDTNNIIDMISLLNKTPEKPYLYYIILDSKKTAIINNRYYDEIPSDFPRGNTNNVTYVKRIVSIDSIPVNFVPHGKSTTSFIVEEK